jgi:soluble cytochrome b562
MASSPQAASFRCRYRRAALVATLLLANALGPLVSTAPADEQKSKKKSGPPVVRWSESQPGCTFSTTEDGKYSYGLWSGDVGIVLAVDAREVQIIRHRIEPIFGVLLTIRYRGNDGLDVSTDAITLQFMKHFKVVQTSLDTDDYTEKIQADADALDDETRRIVEKRPEQKQAREARLQDYQKSVSELIEFLGKHSLRTTHLDHGNPEASGWVFFNTANKWIGGWKAQEEFILRLPLDGKVFEFPFKLPPKAGELLLRKRE